jgi:hypothetical protein
MATASTSFHFSVNDVTKGFTEFIFGDFAGAGGQGGFGGGLELADGGERGVAGLAGDHRGVGGLFGSGEIGGSAGGAGEYFRRVHRRNFLTSGEKLALLRWLQGAERCQAAQFRTLLDMAPRRA